MNFFKVFLFLLFYFFSLGSISKAATTVYFGISPTFLNLQQSNVGKQLRDYYVTGKFGVSFGSERSQLSFGLSSFSSLFSFLHDKGSIGSASVLGVNARGGFRFSSTAKVSHLQANFGWYFVKTVDSTNTIGFFQLSGPQIFLQFNLVSRNNPVLWTYIKFAPLIESKIASFKFYNREVAGGIGIRISESTKKVSSSVVLDVSQLQYTNTNSITAKSRSFSLGMQMGI